MRTYVQVIIDLRRKKKDDTYPIAFRIIHNRIPTTIQTGYSIQKKYWDNVNGKVKRGCKSISDPTSFNLYIKKKEVELMKLIRELDDRGILQNMSISELKNKLKNSAKKKQDDSFINFAKMVITDLKKEKRYGTASASKDALNFIIKYSKKNDISFSELNTSFLKLLEKRYMANPDNHYNGLAAYLRSIRSMFNKAIIKGYANESQYPFRRTALDKFKYHIRTEKTKKRAVTKEIIKQIEAFNNGNESLKRYKYYFLFSFYTMGMNMVDIAHLKKKNISNNVLTYKRAKTGKTYEIRLNEKAWNILRYFGYDNKKRNDLLFPIIKTPQNVEKINIQIKTTIGNTNKALKKIATLLGLDETKLTTYVSRHTWATIADKSGIDRRIISQGLGHANLHTTEIYIDDIESGDALADANDLITG